MTITGTPRAQNKNILEFANELAHLIKAGNIAKRAHDAELLINRLMDEFESHIEDENAYLLPHLFQHPNKRVRDTAHRSQTMMNQFIPDIMHWRHKWRAARIEDDPENFYAETHYVFMRLKEQIDNENVSLFPLAD